MPKKKHTGKPKPLYCRQPPRPESAGLSQAAAATNATQLPDASRPSNPLRVGTTRAPADFPHAHALAPAHFERRDDGSIGAPSAASARSESAQPAETALGAPPSTLPRLVHSDSARNLRLHHGNCLELLDAIDAKYPEGRFDCIFADPPVFPLARPTPWRYDPLQGFSRNIHRQISFEFV